VKILHNVLFMQNAVLIQIASSVQTRYIRALGLDAIPRPNPFQACVTAQPFFGVTSMVRRLTKAVTRSVFVLNALKVKSMVHSDLLAVEVLV
jgi:hypothetical protein